MLLRQSLILFRDERSINMNQAAKFSAMGAEGPFLESHCALLPLLNQHARTRFLPSRAKLARPIRDSPDIATLVKREGAGWPLRAPHASCHILVSLLLSFALQAHRTR